MRSAVVLAVVFGVVVCCCFRTAQSAQVTCSGLGSFADGGDFFHILNRPIQTLPNCAQVSSFKLHLNTRLNPEATQILDPFDVSTVTGSNFDFAKDTKVLVHGFTDNYAWPWWADTKTALLNELDVNVIRVEWAALPPLIQAAANARLLGAYVAKLFNDLQATSNYDPVRVHLIGHSLGAQLVGYIGERVNKIGRITGIDPAGLYFTNMPVSVRLDPTDARVVDTINTDSGSLINFAFGTVQPMGHLNFYVNGGSNQPGCTSGASGFFGSLFGSGGSFNTSAYDILATVTQSGYNAVMCNHYRALALFQETIRSNRCQLKSYECPNLQQYEHGDCFTCSDSRKCSNLGLHLDTSLAEPTVQKNLYAVTSDRSPYCTTTYRIGFTLKSGAGRQEQGDLFAILHGSRGRSTKFQLNKEEVEFTPGAQYAFLVSTNQDLGPLLSVTFEWNAAFSVLPSEFLRRHYLIIGGRQLQVILSTGQSHVFQFREEQLIEEREHSAISSTV
ncbi:Inactive pancreatic lipase-related protein 1 [Hypsibius exemplaris]|uniref:Inactive pancreatic lipase-related protein 1 n=1 Tax=Hypsibius exemplaris TaxID=2072580 RepID=A0A1W0WJY3_HYPEX|nr:Inactive pancreatic lipase-related protein 1 [Hypsibius exemplaris]